MRNMKKARVDVYSSLISDPDVLPVHQNYVKDPDLALVSGAFIYNKATDRVFYTDEIWAYNHISHVWLFAEDYNNNYAIASYEKAPQPVDREASKRYDHLRVVAWCQSTNNHHIIEHKLMKAMEEDKKNEKNN